MRIKTKIQQTPKPECAIMLKNWLTLQLTQQKNSSPIITNFALSDGATHTMNQVNSESINIRHAELKKSHNQYKRKTHQKSLENNTRSNQSQNLIETHQITIKF